MYPSMHLGRSVCIPVCTWAGLGGQGYVDRGCVDSRRHVNREVVDGGGGQPLKRGLRIILECFLV